MKNPKISIIVPVYNTAIYLEECLNSLREQTLKEIEIICVNDGSKDNSLEVLQTIATTDSRITIINQTNGGPSKARNAGIEAAQGEYIGFCDSDDFVDSNYFETLYHYATKYDADMASAYVYVNSKERNEYGGWLTFEPSAKIEFVDLNEKVDLVFKNHNVVVYKHVYKREFIQKNNLHFETTIRGPEDQLFSLIAISLSNKFIQIPIDKSPKYYHQFDRGNLSLIANDEKYILRLKNVFETLDLMLSFLEKINLTNETYNKMLTVFEDIALGNINNCVEQYRDEIQKLWNNIMLSHIISRQNIYPHFTEKSIPIIFSSNNAYAPYLCVALQSLLANSTPTNNYEIYVLQTDISNANKNKISSIAKSYKNVSLRFLNITLIVNSYIKLFHISDQFSVETYYRFFIPKLFVNFEKVVYLDSDILILSDISFLYNYQLKDSILGACHDLFALNSCNFYSGTVEYFQKTLKLQNPRSYFQAGVLIMNIPKLLEFEFTEKCLERLKEIQKPIWADQDILNSVCQGFVTYFDVNWNYCWHYDKELLDETFKSFLSHEKYLTWKRDSLEYNIIHYASPLKPWFTPEKHLAEYFWKYARLTPFYEEILFTNLKRANETKQLQSCQSSTDSIPVSHAPEIPHKKTTKYMLLGLKFKKEQSPELSSFSFFNIPIMKKTTSPSRVTKYLLGIPYKITKYNGNTTRKYILGLRYKKKS